jgi:ribosomal protein L5
MHYKKYYESIVRPCLLSKFNHTNLNEILRFKDCTLTISFYNENAEEDIRILHALFLLELLSGQKAFVKDVSCLYRAKTKSLVFVLKVSLNDENLFNFLQMFFFIAIPNFRLRYVTRNFKIDKKSFGFFFAFKDMNVFTSLPEVYYK